MPKLHIQYQACLILLHHGRSDTNVSENHAASIGRVGSVSGEEFVGLYTEVVRKVVTHTHWRG